MHVRASGILLHITSLPSAFGIGDLGPAAREFASFIAALGQSYWQILPTCPTGYGSSPYAGTSAFAGNPDLLSPEMLVEEGFLRKQDMPERNNADPRRVDYSRVGYQRDAMFAKAFEYSGADITGDPSFVAFLRHNADWLEDWALFATLKDRFDRVSWCDWPEEYRYRDAEALDKWRDEGSRLLARERFVQYLFHRQWESFREFCNDQGVNVIGDMPIYVTYDSADVWSRPELYQLDATRKPIFVAGVPPDYFSTTGQRWGNPVYAWEAHRAEKYAWWTRRFKHGLKQCDFMRVDHFRGFCGYWSIPADEQTAVNGEWVDAPGQELFTVLLRRFGVLPLIAEDLGVITADVRELKHVFGFPGMKIVQFAFGKEWAKHVPHLYDQDCVAYTGTHDNNTVAGWFVNEANQTERQTLARYLGRVPTPEDVHMAFIRLAMQSVANTTIFPMQDVLGLGSTHRMNRPATLGDNWLWRLLPSEMDLERLAWFKEMTAFFDRVL